MFENTTKTVVPPSTGDNNMTMLYATIAMIVSGIGIIAFKRGISGSAIGSAATSETTRVDTSSLTSSSPICLLPIIFRQIAMKKYISIVLISIEAIVFSPCFPLCREKIKKFNIFLKKGLTIEKNGDIIYKLTARSAQHLVIEN